jgi:nicotinate-nucleotide adenylyltransferase
VRTGLYGGSFDPIHAGHVAPAQAARRALGLDRVLFLPTARPPHKAARGLAPASARFAMVELALLYEEGLFVSAHELREDRPSYTVETLEHFHRTLPEDELFLLLGSDSLAALASWRRWRELPELAELVVLHRPGWERSQLAPEIAALLGSGRVHFVDNPPIEVSATELRRCLACGESLPADTVPQLVLDYVHKYGLYRDNPVPDGDRCG